MSKATCVESGCNSRRHCLGLCGFHYRVFRNGAKPTNLQGMRRSHQDRFWAKVDQRGPTECWPWTAGMTDDGYGSFRPGGTAHCMSASRYSWMLANPTVAITPQQFVCHTCDNRACVNPAHLFIGTALDNARDKIAKGRARYATGPRRPTQPRQPSPKKRAATKPVSVADFEPTTRPGKSERLCADEGCAEKHEAHGLCRLHYRRWIKHGDTQKRKGGRPYQGRTEGQIKVLIRNSVSIDGNGCWIWQKSRTKSGYGHLRWKHVSQAHRVAYTAFIGPIEDGLLVRHRCDVRACVNPDHLLLGTHGDNMADMVSKGRSARGRAWNGILPPRRDGERCHLAKLTDAQVREIRSSSGRHVDTAAKYGVAAKTVSRIRRGLARTTTTPVD